MSQATAAIANMSRTLFRAAVNSIAQAIQSQNSGLTEPTETYPYMWWADTTAGLLKQRNAANNAWISILTLSTGVPLSVAGKAALGENSDIVSLKIGVQGSFKNYAADALGVNNYNLVISAAGLVLKNGSDQYLSVASMSKTVNANGTVGAPLSIMSIRAASTWYYAWAWYNATLGLTATLDISSTAPTAPTGYVSTDYRALLPGASRTDASGSTYLRQIKTRNNSSQHVVLAASNTAAFPQIQSGTTGDVSVPTWTAVAVSPAAPPNAVSIRGFYSAQSGTRMLNPNNQAGAFNSTTNPALVMVGHGSPSSEPFDFLLESANIYVASNSGGNLNIFGWGD